LDRKYPSFYNQNFEDGVGIKRESVFGYIKRSSKGRASMLFIF
jgi:hypothetical protein